MPSQDNSIERSDVVGGVLDSFCSLASDPDRFFRVATNTDNSPFSIASTPIRLLIENNPDAFARSVNFYRGVLCGKLPAPPSEGVPPPPFQGGQCDVLYNYDAQFTVDGSPTSGVFPVTNVLGPLNYVTGVDGNGRSFARVLDGNGQEATGTSVSPGQGTAGINVTNVTRVDGLPDDCGNLPTSFDPATPSDYTVPVTFPTTDPMGNPVDEPADIIFGPPVPDGNGGFKFPFEILFPDGSGGGGDITDSPDPVSLRPGPDETLRECCNDTPVEEGEEEDEEPETGDIIACVVRSSLNNVGNPVRPLEQSGPNPDIYLPDLGLVQFKVRTGDNNSAWTTPRRIQSIEQYVEAPAAAVAVGATPRFGVTFDVKVVRRK